MLLESAIGEVVVRAFPRLTKEALKLNVMDSTLIAEGNEAPDEDVTMAFLKKKGSTKRHTDTQLDYQPTYLPTYLRDSLYATPALQSCQYDAG